jgi:signal transduction histidine kinase/ActR/RegA family two-component response regulator
MATSVETMRRRLGVAQVEAMFDFIPVAAIAAAAASAILSGGLASLGYVKPWTAVAWVGYLVICALCNLALRQAYLRSPSGRENWRAWALAFTAINVAVGLGFGWAPMGLAVGAVGERPDLELLVLIVTLCVASGAIVAFGPYLLTFVLFFLSATLPFTVASFFSSDPLLHRLVPMLMPIFIGGMGGLGIRANRSFAQLVSLQIRAEQMAEDLQRQKEIAERANLAKSTFLAAASHDLRQPVHALGLFVGALRGLVLPREAEPLIDQIDASISALDGLFGALLDISRLEAGVVPVQRRSFPIRPILERVCRDCAADADASGVRLTWVESAAILDADPVLMERILRNLVSNAVRYTHRGRILVGTRRRGAAISLQVWDTGIGIPIHEQDRIFQEYYQIGNPERDRGKGLGLGLAIVRRLADLMGCDLSLRSEPGKGSCFAVSVPLANQTSRPETPAADIAPAVSGAKLIVVIDDEVAVREGTARLLATWGHRVVAAGSGGEAIERLSSCPSTPDLLFCDYRLPGDENGIEVIERLRGEYNASIPAILVTGDTAPDRLAEARASGLVLLHKPVPNGKLRAAVANVIAAAELRADMPVEREEGPLR